MGFDNTLDAKNLNIFAHFDSAVAPFLDHGDDASQLRVELELSDLADDLLKSFKKTSIRAGSDDGRLGFVMPAVPENFFFSNGALNGMIKDAIRFTKPKLYNRIHSEEKGTLKNYIKICLELSRCVRRLHEKGLAHGDLSPRNCVVDPTSGKALLIDLDELVAPDLSPSAHLGTYDFMAPEIVKTMLLDESQRKFPSRETDLHSLAVLIYMLLFRRHPLKGDRIFNEFAEEDARLAFGEKALFIENPFDRANALSKPCKEALQP